MDQPDVSREAGNRRHSQTSRHAEAPPAACGPVSRLTIQRISAALNAPLPGRPAQRRITIRPLPGGFAPPEGEVPKPGGVLILLYPAPAATPGDSGWYLPLMKRTDDEGAHSGQVSLPGGGREGAEELAQTALRETHEELGVPEHDITLLGRLTPLYIPASGYTISPFVGYAGSRPDFRSDPREVRELLEVPLSLFLGEAAVREETWFFGTLSVKVPFYAVGEHKVWGATAMVLSEFAVLLRREMRRVLPHYVSEGSVS
jgi:8-oxo-dGTP pyrophosphatase MutT (NUDIX family)